MNTPILSDFRLDPQLIDLFKKKKKKKKKKKSIIILLEKNLFNNIIDLKK